MANERVGFIGIGHMGGAMAMRLRDTGFPLTVCDPDPAAIAKLTECGAQVAATPREVADAAEVVIASLPSLQASLDVAVGAQGIAKGRAIKVYVETSTLGTSTVSAIVEQLRPTGIEYLDTSVAGGPRGPAGVREGMLTMLCCGARNAFERAEPALAAIARNLFYLGEKQGMAQLAKLINSHLSKAGKVAAFEGIVMGLKAGLDPKALIDYINLTTGRNSTTMDKIPAAIFSGTFKHAGPLDKGLKDAELFLEEAKRLGTPVWLGPGILKMFQDAAAHGYKDRDSMHLIEYMQELAGVDAASRLAQKPQQPKE